MAKWRFRFNGDSQILDSKARSFAPGKFIELSDGIVHYEIAGPVKGQPVVLVHGFSLPSYIWDPTFDALTRAGFRVLRYDLYSRGYSDRPDTVYNQDLFDRQLLNLISTLGIERPADLIGLSMGGAISAIFTDRHPTMVRKLCLVDPAGLSHRSLLAKLMQAPVLGELAIKLMQAPVLGELLKNLFFNPKRFPERARSQMKYVGYRRALLSTLRHGPVGDITATYERVGKQERPTLLIWGRKDQLHPFETSEDVRRAIPHIKFHAIHASHIPHYEQPEVVNPLLIEFLRN